MSHGFLYDFTIWHETQNEEDGEEHCGFDVGEAVESWASRHLSEYGGLESFVTALNHATMQHFKVRVYVDLDTTELRSVVLKRYFLYN